MQTPDSNLTFVFDMAGVLVEWNPNALFDAVFEASGKDQGFFLGQVFGDEIQNAISAGEPMDALIANCVGRWPDWESEIRLYWERWDEMLVGEISGTVSVVQELRERGHRIYVLGNWGREEFHRAQPRLKFLELFDDILISGDCGFLKPDPEIFRLAESRFGLTPEKTVFIDDKAANVDAAIGRNWNGIVFENPRQLYLVLMEYGIL